jgi:cobalt-zinc-cadmium efflux system outer membrane protein
MMRSAVLVLLLQVVLCPHVSAESVTRNINEISALALKHSAELAALEKDESAKHSLAIQAGTFSNPTLEIQGATGSLTGSPDDRSLSIGFNQEFPLNSKLSLRQEAVQREAEAIKLQRNNAARLLKDEVTTLCLDYLMASKRQELASELRRLNRELVGIAVLRFEAGDISELDLNIAKVELARSEARFMQTEREKIPLRIKIGSLTGLKESEIILSDKFKIPKLTPNTDELVNSAISSRPDLLALKRESEKAETEVRLAEAESLPNLTAGVFVQWQRGTTVVGGMSSINSDAQLGLRLSMPIPVFDRNTDGRAAARARLDSANSRRIAMERSIVADVETAVSQVTKSEIILAMFEQGIIPQLTENMKLTKEAYRIGETGIISVIEEQKKFLEVNESHLSALHNRLVSLVKLESAVATELTGGVQ